MPKKRPIKTFSKTKTTEDQLVQKSTIGPNASAKSLKKLFVERLDTAGPDVDKILALEKSKNNQIENLDEVGWSKTKNKGINQVSDDLFHQQNTSEHDDDLSYESVIQSQETQPMTSKKEKRLANTPIPYSESTVAKVVAQLINSPAFVDQMRTIVQEVVEKSAKKYVTPLVTQMNEFKKETNDNFTKLFRTISAGSKPEAPKLNKQLELLVTENQTTVGTKIRTGNLMDDDKVIIDGTDFTEDVEQVYCDYGSRPTQFPKQLACQIFGLRQMRWFKLTKKEDAIKKNQGWTDRESFFKTCPELAQAWLDICSKYYNKIVGPLKYDELKSNFLNSNSNPSKTDKLNFANQAKKTIYKYKTDCLQKWMEDANQYGQDYPKYKRKGVNVWYWRLVEGGYKPTPEWSWKNDIIFKEYMAIKRDRSAKNLSKKQYNEQYDEDEPNNLLRKIRLEQKRLYYDRNQQVDQTVLDSDDDDDKVFDKKELQQYPAC